MKRGAATATTLDDFVVLAELGRGAFGRVSRVQRKADGRQYALKSISLRGRSRREIKDALNEALLLSRLSHPNVVRYHECFVSETGPDLCLVMELAAGGDLASRVDKAKRAGTRLREDVIWAFALQLLDGLAYLHRKRVAHRDLKTGNVFLVGEGRVKIGDLNISRLLAAGGRAALAHTQIGGWRAAAGVGGGGRGSGRTPVYSHHRAASCPHGHTCRHALLHVAGDLAVAAVRLQVRHVGAGRAAVRAGGAAAAL
jgi:serine/threonine protein kinase